MIRVLRVEAIPVPFRLTEGYRIAGHTYTSAENIVVKVDTSDGRTGFGCAAPAPEVTGEAPADALRALLDQLIPLLRMSDADIGEDEISKLRDRIRKARVSGR